MHKSFINRCMTTSTELLHYQTSSLDKFHHFTDVPGQTILEIGGLTTHTVTHEYDWIQILLRKVPV
jgi:hypothetical protein